MRILIADDNEINRDFLCAVLRSRGYETATAVDGAKAVAACRYGRFDLILMDIRMPQVDGLEATEQIRSLPGYDAVPVLALTADLQVRQRDRLLERGFAAALLKPVSRDELLAAIATARGEAPARAPAARAREDTPVDRATALAAAGGNRELVERLVSMLGRELEAFRPRINAALAADERASARELAHKLRASAGFCGALSLRDRAGQLEQVLAVPDRDPGPAHEAFEAAADALERHLARPG